MRPTQPILQPGPRIAATACLLVLIGMAVAWLISHVDARDQLHRQADRLGETLASQTALLVTELVLSNDLISLNVLLDELTRNAAISQAAVFTIDDQVLAISGTSVSLSDPQTGRIAGSYVAPIALQDSVAGYVRIHLDQRLVADGRTQHVWMMIGAILVMGLLTGTVMLVAFRPTPEAEPESLPPRPDSLPANAVLHLSINRSDAVPEERITALTTRLQQIAGLYHAVVHEESPGELQLRFKQPENAEELAYQALCCATLVIALNNRENRHFPAPRQLLLQAGLHCGTPDADTTGLSGEENTARVAALAAGQSPDNGLLATADTLTLAGADNHFHTEWCRQVMDLSDGELLDLYLVRSPSGATRTLLQRQAALLRQQPQAGSTLSTF